MIGKFERLSLVVLAGVLGLSGCSTDPPGMRSDEFAIADYPRLVAVEGLDKAVVASKPIVTPGTDDKPMRVTVPVRSLHLGGPLNVQYRFRFMGADGRPLASNVGWRFVRLEPKVQVFLDGNALETSAADWRLEVRPAR